MAGARNCLWCRRKKCQRTASTHKFSQRQAFAAFVRPGTALKPCRGLRIIDRSACAQISRIPARQTDRAAAFVCASLIQSLNTGSPRQNINVLLFKVLLRGGPLTLN